MLWFLNLPFCLSIRLSFPVYLRSVNPPVRLFFALLMSKELLPLRRHLAVSFFLYPRSYLSFLSLFLALRKEFRRVYFLFPVSQANIAVVEMGGGKKEKERERLFSPFIVCQTL